jgi:ketosteroid isomerase-like protein
MKPEGLVSELYQAFNERDFERRGCAVAEVEGGKIVRYRDYFDRAQMYAPLGLMHLLTR